MAIVENFKKLFINTVPTTQTTYTTAISEPARSTEKLKILPVTVGVHHSTPDLLDNHSIHSSFLSSQEDGISANDYIMTAETTTSEFIQESSISFDANLNDFYPDLPSNYKLVCTLGEGAFSTVYKAIDIDNNTTVAIKIIEKANLSAKQFHNIKNEIQIMKRLDHPNLLKLVDSIDTLDHCFLVLEHCDGGEIFNKIIEYTYFSEELSIHVFKQLLSAIEELHKLNIVHRDIKPENLLFKKIPYFPRSKETFKKSLRRSDDENKADEGEFKPNIGGGTIGSIRLADFGLAKQLVDDVNDVHLKTPCGTAGYTAPEVITCNTRHFLLKKSKNYYSKSVDIWSLGCFLYTILCGFPPFYDDDSNNLTIKILKGDFVFLRPWWDEISTDAKDLISRMLTINPDARITIDEIWRHPWLQSENKQSLPEPKEPTHYFETKSYEVYHVEENTMAATVLAGGAVACGQAMDSPRANAIRKVFDNPAMTEENLVAAHDVGDLSEISEEDADKEEEEEEGEEEEEDQGDSSSEENDDDDEEESPDPQDQQPQHVGYLRTPYPKAMNEMFDDDDAEEEDEVEEDDEVDEVSELGQKLTNIKTRARGRSSSSNKIKKHHESLFAPQYLEPDQYLSTTTTNSSIESSGFDMENHTRSSSIISGINGESITFNLNLNDSNLLSRRKSSKKNSDVSNGMGPASGLQQSCQCA
ncbi:uncharacterized protein J8A68_004119 [[Candida] subhashii]|uniref:Protein kinase domain-containing protein n=1 Tax=[Candida] subhashii TaxID=561895 RepID=A0A8J5QKY3_9ASCO|nr:uncharacterized protein J8A68_004119 [[Candida] subhashii]KAG7662348.1 hypothetical protein J8A68_004119 [[Candida] subhashii]